MLSDEEKQEIREELQHYADKSALSIDALRIVQRHHGGYVSDEAIQDISEFLEITPTELDAVATFYNLIFRHPVGRHVIMICNSISCYVMGYENMRSHLNKILEIDLGQTTPDGRFTLLPTVCLGICDHAPAMMVDEDLHVDLDDTKIESVLEKYA